MFGKKTRPAADLSSESSHLLFLTTSATLMKDKSSPTNFAYCHFKFKLWETKFLSFGKQKKRVRKEGIKAKISRLVGIDFPKFEHMPLPLSPTFRAI